MNNYLNLEPYEYRFIYPDDYDEHEDPMTVSVEIDNLSSVDVVDITGGLITSGSVVYLNGRLYTFFSYRVSSSDKYVGRDKILLFNKQK